MDNSKRLAEWWCDLNAWRWPVSLGLPHGWNGMSKTEREAATAGAWRVVDALAEQDGLALWRKRLGYKETQNDD